VTDTSKDSPAIAAQRAAVERLKAATEAERVRELDSTHGRSVGGVMPRIATERERAADDLAPPVKEVAVRTGVGPRGAPRRQCAVCGLVPRSPGVPLYGAVTELV
jgi:hypothetical protein